MQTATGRQSAWTEHEEMEWKSILFKKDVVIKTDSTNSVQGDACVGNLVRTGECNHCGKCCKPPSMLENPMIERGEDRCKFYVETENDKLYGHCLIYGHGGKPIKSVKDRFGKTITDGQITWFNANCIEYPSVKDAEAGYKLPEGCGFSFEEQA